MGDPQAPGLPKEAPADLGDFVDCKGQTVSIASGKLDWLPMPEELKGFGKPELSFKPGKVAGTVTITIDFQWAPAIEVTGSRSVPRGAPSPGGHRAIRGVGVPGPRRRQRLRRQRPMGDPGNDRAGALVHGLRGADFVIEETHDG